MKRLLTLLPALLILSTTYSQIGGTWDFGSSPNVPVNVAPFANAGADQVITLPTNLTTLVGGGTDVDGTVVGFAWKQLTGTGVVSIANPSFQNTQVGPFTTAGSYSFELKVTDNVGAVDRDTVVVTINAPANIPPTANAGADIPISLPLDSVTTAGSGADTDGTISFYSWTKVSGPAGGLIVDPSLPVTKIKNLVQGIYEFRLTVTDNSGATASDLMQVWVAPAIPPANIPPTVNAGTNQVLTLPTNNTSITAVASDADGTISTYSWIQVSGPSTATIATPTTATTNITGMVQGVYEFKVTVTDNGGATATSTVQITVNAAVNIPPVSHAGPDITVSASVTSVAMAGSGTDADGTVVSYLWTRISRRASTRSAIADPTNPTTLITTLIPGTYTFQLRVTDNNGAIGVDDMVLTVLPPVGAKDGKFTFSVPSTMSTSAGVYRHDTVLVKVLWSDSTVTAGTHTGVWDGTDDFGNAIPSPDAAYTVRVLRDNVQYIWQGTIGNTSDIQTGPAKLKGGYHTMQGLCFVGSTGYYCTGYGEGTSPTAKFNVATPNQKTTLSLFGDVNYVCSDGTLVYWAWLDANSPNNNMVVATKVSDDQQNAFPTGVSYGSHVSSAIAKVDLSNSAITGLAVQPTGNYLFVARAGQNTLYVLNKTTGTAVRTLGFTNIQGITCDNSNNIWIIHSGNTVQKYSVDGSGILSTMGVLTGVTSPLSVWTGNGLVAVCEGGNSQIVKFFNNSTLTATTSLGTPGGYFTNSTVTDTKFYFTDVNGQGIHSNFKTSFVAWQPDGSYWVQDAGNFRIQHFSSAGTFINRVMSLGSTYSVFIDRGNINRLFVENLEFEMDYAVQNLTGTAGWILKRNWGPSIDVALYGDSRPRYPITLSNSRTYAVLRKNYDYEIVECQTNGPLRFTGVLRSGLGGSIAADGSWQDFNQSGNTITMYRYPLTGFDASGNPQWASTAEIMAVNTVDATNGNPIAIQYFQAFDPITGKVLWYQPSPFLDYAGTIVSKRYHLGLQQRGSTNQFQWEIERSTHRNYRGDYPPPSYFDVGNSVNGYAGGWANIMGHHIMTSYHGEFWKNGQTNKFNHYWDNGLSIGQFGVASNEMQANTPAYPGMAGNATSPVMVKDAVGDIYLYHGDEAHHAAAHRWKMTGINTIGEEVIPLDYPVSYVPAPLTYIDLMAGLPWDATLTTGTNGWTRSPINDILTNPYGDYWQILTSRSSVPNTKGGNSLYLNAVIPVTANYGAQRDLDPSGIATSWKLTGVMSYGLSNTGDAANRNCYFDILDDVGNIITRMYQVGSYQQPSFFYANTVVVRTADAGTLTQELSREMPLEINVTSTNVTFKVGTYGMVTTTKMNAAAHWDKPTKLRIAFANSGSSGQGMEIYVEDLKLYKF